MQEYDRLVKLGKLRDDTYQRGIISSLGDLYDSLVKYVPPVVKTPNAVDQVGGWLNGLKPYLAVANLRTLGRMWMYPKLVTRYLEEFTYMEMLAAERQC